MVRPICATPLSPRLTIAGIPTYRTLVQYVPQRPSLLPGTPLDFLTKLRSFAARRRPTSGHSSQYGSIPDNDDLDPIEIAARWGIEKTMWQREWSTLSGGEAQRVALAVAVGIGGAEILLLDGMYSCWFSAGELEG
jgi:ABC-type iron transport system FetAB ATPase subunit